MICWGTRGICDGNQGYVMYAGVCDVHGCNICRGMLCVVEPDVWGNQGYDGNQGYVMYAGVCGVQGNPRYVMYMLGNQGYVVYIIFGEPWVF